MVKNKDKQQMVKYDTLEFKRGYIAALFEENERWITCIEKYWMIVPGNPKNRLHRKQDLALKEKLADQIHPDTYQRRKAYYEASLNAKRCDDECNGIKNKPVPSSISKLLDPDVRRFIEKYRRFWLESEREKAFKYMSIRGGLVYGDGREVFDQADSNDTVWDGGRKGIGRSGKFKEDPGNPYQRQKESFLWSGSGGMAFEKSFEYWGQ